MADKYSLKDDLFNKESVSYLCSTLKSVMPEFKDETYLKDALNKFPELELKERMTYLTVLLYNYLPQDFIEATTILKQSLANAKRESMFAFGCYCEYVNTYGCNDTYIDESLDLLCEFTKWFSSEFAIRDFIINYPDKTFEQMKQCSLSDDTDQRRFASEGLRPKLPWAKGIVFDYKKGASLLNNLYYDKERYVTRSVANHLNDLSKIDPSFVLQLLEKWQDEGKQDADEFSYMVNHSLRTLIKKGHKETLEFLGYRQEPNIEVSELSITTPQLKLGDSLKFSFNIKALEDEQLIVDYQVTYPMASNKRSTKVFKLKKTLFSKDCIITINKNHPFRAMTTKKLYSGTYELDVQINGKFYSHGTFELNV